MKRKYFALLSLLFILLFIVNYPAMDSWVIKHLGSDEFAVKRIIDGDTIVVGDDLHVRLLGINCPERGEKYYSEAKEYLRKRILDRNVRLEYGKQKQDRYHRTLAYIYLDGKNINKEIVSRGLANFYFPSGKTKYYQEFYDAWESCKENLCEKAQDKCARCIYLKKFDYRNQEVDLENRCSFDCDLSDWEIKDEGRKKFIFPEFNLESGKDVEIIVGEGIDSKSKLFWNKKPYVWTKSGDTLLLRDDLGKLVLWKSY